MIVILSYEILMNTLPNLNKTLAMTLNFSLVLSELGQDYNFPKFRIN